MLGKTYCILFMGHFYMGFLPKSWIWFKKSSITELITLELWQSCVVSLTFYLSSLPLKKWSERSEADSRNVHPFYVLSFSYHGSQTLSQSLNQWPFSLCKAMSPTPWDSQKEALCSLSPANMKITILLSNDRGVIVVFIIFPCIY